MADSESALTDVFNKTVVSSKSKAQLVGMVNAYMGALKNCRERITRLDSGDPSEEEGSGDDKKQLSQIALKRKLRLNKGKNDIYVSL